MSALPLLPSLSRPICMTSGVPSCVNFSNWSSLTGSTRGTPLVGQLLPPSQTKPS